MPRKPREKSETGIYHIVMCGINRQIIFADEEDSEQFLRTLLKYRDKSGYQVFAYCLMGNHLHLLLKEGPEPLEQMMRRLCGSYVYWYNNKYQRTGNLFQDRFKSKPVRDDVYFQIVLRYIHQRPVKAGLTEDASRYPWSSMQEYLGQASLVDTDFVLRMFSEDREQALQRFIQYAEEESEHECLDIDSDTRTRISDETARDIVKSVCQVQHAADLQRFDIAERNKQLRTLKQEYHLSVRQLERVTGINRGVVLKA